MDEKRMCEISEAIIHYLPNEKISAPEHPGFPTILWMVKNIDEIAKGIRINVGELWDYVKIVDMERREELDECK